MTGTHYMLRIANLFLIFIHFMFATGSIFIISSRDRLEEISRSTYGDGAPLMNDKLFDLLTKPLIAIFIAFIFFYSLQIANNKCKSINTKLVCHSFFLLFSFSTLLFFILGAGHAALFDAVPL